MKVFRKIRTVALFVMFSLVCSNLHVMNVSAGASDIVVDNTSFAEALDTAKWGVPNADVLVENGKIVFPENSTDQTRIITRAAATDSGVAELFQAEYTINLKKVSQGQSFIAAFGLANIESQPGNAGNLEVVFQNNGSIQVGIMAYDENGDAIAVAKFANCGVSQKKNFTMSVNAGTDNSLKVTVNGKNLFNGKSPVKLAGRMGFLQTGQNHVEISNVKIVSHRYDRPENANIIEDFESGSININTMTSLMKSSCSHYPAGLQVEEYNGSQVFMFRNANLAYLGTTQQYSNFEMSFDMPYVQHENILREDGSLKLPQHAGFVLTFGDETEDYDYYGYTTSSYGVYFNRTNISIMKGGVDAVNINNMGLYDEKKNEGYSVKMTMIDAVLTIQVKPLDAEQYETIITHKVGNATPLGYIHFFSTGQVNFAIDNLKIINKDDNPNLIEVDYQPKVIKGTEDAEYEPLEVKYLETEETENSWASISWMFPMFGGIASGLIFLAVCLVITRKKVSKREVRQDEKI